jgi:hypothetical protein
MPAPALLPLAVSLEGIDTWALTWVPILFMS